MNHSCFLTELRQCLTVILSNHSVVGSLMLLLSLAILRFLKGFMAASGEDLNMVHIFLELSIWEETTCFFVCPKPTVMVECISGALGTSYGSLMVIQQVSLLLSVTLTVALLYHFSRVEVIHACIYSSNINNHNAFSL